MPDLPAALFWLLPPLALALAMRPWVMLRHPDLQHPWLAMMVVLPWAWSVPGLPLLAAHSAGAAAPAVMVQVSGACLLVLMVGWPLAVCSLLPVALAGAWLAHRPLAAALDGLWWHGLAPATLALLLGAAVRRWLPAHLFVYILGRGFFATALAVSACGMARVLAAGAPPQLALPDLLVGQWLLGWGEAAATGMLVATMVALRPQWLATYSDRLYLPGWPCGGR